jgi:dTDP-glucose pyrophosphorylase
MSERHEQVLIGPDATVLQAVETIDRGGMQIALVVDGERRLLGTVTDGDVRRALLRSVALTAPVGEVMRKDPTTASTRDGREGALRLMRELRIHQVPVVDDEGRVVGLEWIDELVGLESQDTWVVLMAGGLGVRLRPLTETIPKPMLPVGGRPLLESIIRNFADQGYRRFFISVNHRREVVQDHFGDGTALGVQIEYLVEDERLGTAGALSLLPERPTKPLVVMNGDLLTSVHLDNLLRFHADQGAEATMCAREYTTQVPYGVVRMDGSRLISVEEKPSQSCYVNAGIYALSPSVFDLIPSGRLFDMPDLFSAAMAQGRNASVFPLREYWMDIGHIDDLERARTEFDQVFGK